MTPDRQLEALICSQIQIQNYESSRTQCLSANQTDVDAELPRVVVKCDSKRDPVMAQAGVYPVDVQIEIHINALDRSDNYMLDPLSEAAETALAELTSLNDRLVAVHGQTMGDTETRQEGDRVTRIISATVHASLK